MQVGEQVEQKDLAATLFLCFILHLLIYIHLYYSCCPSYLWPKLNLPQEGKEVISPGVHAKGNKGYADDHQILQT